MFGNLGAVELLLIIIFALFAWYYFKKKTSFTTGFIPLLFYFASFATIMTLRERVHGSFLETVVLATVFGGCGYGISIIQKKLAQKRRDKKANQIRIDLSEGKKPVYSLYLRPFISTGKMTMQTSLDFAEIPWLYTPEKNKDLEVIFADALEPIAPLVGLSSESNYEGTGKTESPDQDWQNEIELLAHNAKILIVLPSYNEGIKWEIDWILKNDYLQKSVFFMPPTAFAKSFNWESNWADTKNEIESYGIKLPPYDVKGLIFTYGKNNQINYKKNIGKDVAVPFFRREIKRITEDIFSS
jgi:hypothetical protein